MDRETRISEYLLAEHQNVVKTINDALNSRATMFAVGIALVSYFMLQPSGASSPQYRPYAFVLLPIAVTGLIQYYVHLLHEVSLLRGYRKWLEEQLNASVRARSLLWESSLYGLLESSSIDRFGPLSFGLLFTILVSVWLSIDTYQTYANSTLRHFRPLFWMGFSGFGVLFVFLVKSWFAMKNAAAAAYQEAASNGRCGPLGGPGAGVGQPIETSRFVSAVIFILPWPSPESRSCSFRQS